MTGTATFITIAADAIGAIPIKIEGAVGSNVFGISGMTPGALGIIVVGLFGIAAWYVRGMADRRRAENEGLIAGETVTQAQFNRMVAEIARLSTRVINLEDENLKLHKEIHKLRNDMAGYPVRREGEL